jgi:hypothetical protein
VIGTYAAVLAVCGASLAIGQAAIALCGYRRWSWLAPGVGLALLCASCWGTVRAGGDGVVSAVGVAVLACVSVAYLRGRVEGAAEAVRAGWPVGLLALLAASLPFVVEGHFGILGTSFNPDMSQHLLATDRLGHGHGSQLLSQGYPLGPHAVVVALNKGLGVGLVQGFSGLTIAVAILGPLTALAAFANLRPVPRTGAALVVGLAYVVASYFAQGAFKETMQALFVLAFVLALRESNRSWRDLPLRLLPAALLAVGSVYAYSFAGLVWLVAAAAIWLAIENVRTRQRPPWRALLLGLLVFAVLVVPELGRMLDFQRFETFDPNGPGLGNLFGQISPFEALGIWPSGDFRLAPGDGAVPALAYYLGIAFALALLLWGVVQCWRRHESALLAGLGAGALVYGAARVGGTPYTAAKAIEVAAPLVALAILIPLLHQAEWRFMHRIGAKGARGTVAAAGAGLFLGLAGACSLLALVNAPVGPSSYSPALTGLRPSVAADSTLVLASQEMLAEHHGVPYIAWELRGGRVCIAAEGELDAPPLGVRFVVTRGDASAPPPFPALRMRRAAAPYVLWEATRPAQGESPCPRIAVRQARQGPAP